MKTGVVVFVAGMSAAVHAVEPMPLSKLIEESRAVAVQLGQRVGARLRKEMEFSGPQRGIAVCKFSAPEISAEISRTTGWRVSRVSLRPRNPLTAVPDAWEQQALDDFDKRVAAGEKADGLERAEVVTEPQGRYFRYLKALPVGPACLECHGPVEQLSAAVRLRLATEYPHDKATGYSVGQVRGALSIKRQLTP